ncbi:MAG: hypothetical protein ACOYT8_02240 [Candidatus Dependentiae bacterium]
MKAVKVLFFSIFFLATQAHNHQQKYAQRVKQYFNSYQKEFAQGFALGAASAIGIDFLRNKVLPNLDELKLHQRTGICRDQLTGQLKVASALVGVAALENNQFADINNTIIRTIGVLVGANFAAFATKYVSELLKK